MSLKIVPEEAPRRTRVVLVDESALIRGGVRRILADEPDMLVAAESAHLADAGPLAGATEADVVIIHAAVPSVDLSLTARAIHQNRPSAAILVMSSASEVHAIRQAVDAGARGYILIRSALEADIPRAVRALVAGDHFFSPELAGALARAAAVPPSPADRFHKLTGREKQILQLIANGKSCREIALLLGLSANTVAVHRANVKNTLGIRKTSALVLLAVQRGLVPIGGGGKAGDTL